MSSKTSYSTKAWMRSASCLGLTALVLAPLAGCAKKPAPAPAPAPAPVRAAAPAPAPAPKKAEPSRTIPAGYASSRVYLPTGNFETSSLMIEIVGPTTLSAGVPFDYTVYALNLNEKAALRNVVVHQEVPGELEVAQTNPAGVASTQAALTPGRSVVAFDLGEIAPGQEVSVTGRASTDKVGSIGSCLTAEYELWTCWAAEVVEPALKLTKSVSPANHVVCDPITYTLVVTNDGTGVAKNVTVTDNLPAGVTTTDGSSTFTQAVGDLAPGQSVTMTINAKAAAAGTYTNDATATADGLEVTSNEVTSTACKPALEVSIDGPEMFYITSPFEYTTTVTNTSDCEVRDVVLTNALSGCTVAVSGASDGGSATGAGATWNLGTLAAGASKTVTLNLSGPAPCDIVATADAKGYCAEAADKTETELVGVPAVLLEVVDSPDPVRLGTETVYTITVTNQGTATDTNVAITAELEKFDYVTSTGPTTASVSGKTIKFAPLATLPVGASETWTVRAKSAATGDVRFKVTMRTDNLLDERPVEETEATRVFEESELLRSRTK